MRFISRYGRYGTAIRHLVQEAYATGMAKVVQEPLYAQFEPIGLRPNERELALSLWTFNGSYQHEDQVTTVSPEYRIGVFDTVQAQRDRGWPDEWRIEVEQGLLDRCKTDPGSIALVPEVVIPPPWPRYSEFTGDTEELMRKLVEDGYDLAETLAHERTHQNREDVVESLQALLNDPDAVLELQPEEILG